MTKRVLSVGQCAMDHGSISHLIESQFDATVTSASSRAEAIAELEKGGFDLVLVNRMLDADGSPGMDIIHDLHTSGLDVSVMLVSNFEVAQISAIAAGAKRGFGKSSLQAPATAKCLSEFLPQIT